MARKLKVFGWTNFWNDPRIEKNGHWQVRCICASPSKAEIKRTYNLRDCDMFNCCNTGNNQEIEAAMKQPMVILAKNLNDWSGPFYVMNEPPTESE